ncbi:MAG: hypothetical protein L0210_06570 [Rhodospirillales bacterium]|nr:hypothetical protein [Rhodospirillales bacterium]
MTDYGTYRGRPRLYSSPEARRAAKTERNREFQRQVAAEGLVRVSVLVPAGQVATLKALAATLRQAKAARRAKALPERGHPAIAETDRQLIVLLYAQGAAPQDLEIPGVRLPQIVQLLAATGEYGEPREIMAELLSRQAAAGRRLGR